MRRFALLLSLAFAIAGCSADYSPHAKILPPATLPAGWTMFESTQHHFTMGMPPGWKAVDLMSPSSKIAIEEIGKINPLMPAQVKAALETPEMAMTAMDTKSFKSGYVVSLNFIHRDRIHLTPLNDEALASYRKGLDAELPKGAKISAVNKISLPVGDAIFSRFQAPIPTPSGPQEVASAGYFIPNSNESFIAKFSCLVSDEPRYRALFQQMAETIRIKAPPAPAASNG
jgi:hypothetical protein